MSAPRVQPLAQYIEDLLASIIEEERAKWREALLGLAVDVHGQPCFCWYARIAQGEHLHSEACKAARALLTEDAK